MVVYLKGIIVVDLVNDFISGKFGSPQAEETTNRASRFLHELNNRFPVVFTMDSHFPNDPEFQVWGEHCLQGTWGSELHESLAGIDGFRVSKRHYDSFYDSDLDGILRMLNITDLYVFGISTDICVEHTVAGAFFRNLRVTVIEDLCATIDPALHKQSISAMERNYGTRTVESSLAKEELS